MILSTDMAKHMADLSSLKSVIKDKKIENGKTESLYQIED